MKRHKKLITIAVILLIVICLGVYFTITGPKDAQGFTNKHKHKAQHGIEFVQSLTDKIKLDSTKVFDKTYDYGCSVMPANQTPGYKVGCFVEQVILYQGSGSPVIDLEKVTTAVNDSNTLIDPQFYTIPSHDFAEKFVHSEIGGDSVTLKDNANLTFALINQKDFKPEGQNLQSYFNLNLRNGKGQGNILDPNYLFGYSILVRYASDSCWIGCTPSSPYR